MQNVLKSAAAASLLIGAASFSATAETSVSGFFQYELLTEGSGSESIYGGELDLTLNGGMPFSFNLGVDLLGAEGTAFAALWPSLGFQAGGGQASVGMPRAAVDDYVDLPTLGGTVLFNSWFTDVAFWDNSFTSYVANFAPFSIYGARYDSNAGAMSYGLSVHSFDGEWIGITGGASSDFGAARVSAGFEMFTDGEDSATNFFGAVEFGDERLGGSVGVAVLDIDLDASLYQVNLHYGATDAITLLGGLIGELGGSGMDYTVGARYDMGHGLSASVNNLDGDLWMFTLGAEFGG